MLQQLHAELAKLANHGTPVAVTLPKTEMIWIDRSISDDKAHESPDNQERDQAQQSFANRRRPLFLHCIAVPPHASIDCQLNLGQLYAQQISK